MNSKILFLAAFAAGAAAVYAWRRSQRTGSVLSLLETKEDVDAYNTDDMQPPFEERTPRESHL